MRGGVPRRVVAAGVDALAVQAERPVEEDAGSPYDQDPTTPKREAATKGYPQAESEAEDEDARVRFAATWL